MSRRSIPTNVARQLWAGCGGYCQNPQCNGNLFASIGEEIVSLANMAHIIGHGNKGPRSEHELAEVIEKDGLDNLIMLCLFCHKVVDELEKRFTVEKMQCWKREHESKLKNVFDVPTITNEKDLLMEVNDRLDENGSIFREYGPYSQKQLEGESGDAHAIWRRRCLDTIIPNNRQIINLIEKNKRNFGYPWNVYTKMLDYKLHVEAFEDNVVVNKRANDYKLFPVEFEHFVKTNLGVEMSPLEVREKEEIDFRYKQISRLINDFLSNHSCIAKMEEVNKSTMLVELVDGRSLRVFVTNTYFFTEYTFNKILAIDPCIDVVICSCPSGMYAETAKQLCIEHGVGLFMLGEFMGAVRKSGEEFLNYLLKKEQVERIEALSKPLRRVTTTRGAKVYLFGSYLRRKVYQDIDALIVYDDVQGQESVEVLADVLTNTARQMSSHIDLVVCSAHEFKTLRLEHDNLKLIYSH